MATFYAVPAGEFTPPAWFSTDWGAYRLSVDFDPATGPASLYQAQNALYIPLANANAGGGLDLARDQALALIRQNPGAWSALGIREDNLGDVLSGVHDLFRDRLYNIDKNDLIDVIGQGAVYALIGAAVGNLVGLPSPGELFNAGPADLSGIPADLGYDFTPGPSLLDGSAIPAPAVNPADLLRGIPDDLGYDFKPGPSLLDGAPASSAAAQAASSAASSAARPLFDAAGKLLAPLAPLVPAAIRAAFAGDQGAQAAAAQLKAPAPLITAEGARNLALGLAAIVGGYLIIKATK